MSYAARTAALRQRFVERAAEDEAVLRTALQAGDQATIRQVAHRLSGTAGLFGEGPLGELAWALEDAIDAGVADPAQCSQALLAALARVASPPL